MDAMPSYRKGMDHEFRMLCNVVNLRGDVRYDINAVMGAIERWQEAAALLAARQGETTAECQNLVIEGALAILGATTVDLESEAQRVVDELAAARRGERALRDAAKDCADDLESEIRARYGHPDIHPAMRQKYERDMEPVLLVRAALDAPAARGDEELRHALRVALNVIDELDGFFLNTRAPGLTEDGRAQRLKYLVMRVEDVKALAARVLVEGER